MKKTAIQDTQMQAGSVTSPKLKVLLTALLIAGLGGSYLTYTLMFIPGKSKPNLEPNKSQLTQKGMQKPKSSINQSNSLNSNLTTLKKQDPRVAPESPKWSELFGKEQEQKQIATLKNKLDSLLNVKTYDGLLGAHITSLEQKLKPMSLQLKTENGLPTVQAYQSKLQFQVIDGYVLGADLKFESGFSGADWDMINQILCSGAEYQGHDDPMMFMDEVLAKPTAETNVYQGTWLIKDQASADTKSDLKINYLIQVSPNEKQNSARFWLSSDL